MQSLVFWLAAREKQEWIDEERQVDDARHIKCTVISEHFLGNVEEVSEVNSCRPFTWHRSYRPPLKALSRIEGSSASSSAAVSDCSRASAATCPANPFRYPTIRRCLPSFSFIASRQSLY